MLAHNGGTHKYLPSGNNNQQGCADASQTSDSVVNNCCRPTGALVGVAPIEPSCHMITCQSCEIVSDGNAPPARCTVCGKPWSCTSGYQRQSTSTRVDVKFAPPPITQQLSGCSKDRYEALVEHLHNCLGHLVLCHHSKGIPCENVGHHKDIFHHGGLIQLHRGLDTSVIKMHKLQQSIRSNWTEESPQHFSLECLTEQASPHYSLAILSHHGPPEPLLSKSQGPLLA